MKLKAFLVCSACFSLSLLGLFSQSEGAKVWSGKAQVTALQGESATLVWNVTLTDSDVNKNWTYVKILHAEGVNTSEIVTFKRTGEKTIDNPSYSSRLSDFTFNVSQSGSVVTIRFTMANLVRSTDLKNYKALLGFSNDASTYPGMTDLAILVKPHSTVFKIKPEKNSFCVGDTVNVTCTSQGIPPAQISLFLNNQLVQKQITSVTLTLSLNDKGENNFHCVPENTAGIGQTKVLKLDVKEPPTIVRCKINNKEVTSTSVNEGTKVTLSCQVTGSEPLSITWRKENTQTSLSQSNILIFDSINRRDSGQYRVTAYNGIECKTTVSEVFNVKVMYLNEPRVLGKKYKVVSPDKPEAQFKVIVEGSPRPRLTCRREGGPSSSFSNVSTTYQASGSEWTFFIEIFAKENEKYFCDFSNVAGNRFIKFQLYKQGPPIKINGTFILTNKPWKEDLRNPRSDAFFRMNTKINEALKLVYENEEFVTYWRVLEFVKGSVAVNFQLDVIANVTDPIILFKNAVEKNGGEINELPINANSIKKGYSSTTKDGETASKTTDDETKRNVGLGLGLGLGLGILILVLLVIASVVCWRKRRAPSGSGMEMTPLDRRSSSPHDETYDEPLTPSAVPGKKRKAPRCKKCGELMKGHKKDQCQKRVQVINGESRDKQSTFEIEIRPDGTRIFRGENVNFENFQMPLNSQLRQPPTVSSTRPSYWRSFSVPLSVMASRSQHDADIDY